MSIASRIQEIETHIGNAYTSIDNLGIDISNTNKNIYNISALLDTFYESLPKVSGEGSYLSLSPTKVGRIKLDGIYGDTFQQTYSGKQLFDKSVSPSSQNGTSTTELSTGIRATVTSTGQNKYTAIALPNPSSLLGKTLTISATINISGTNTALIRFYWLNGTALTSLIANTISTTGSTQLTIPNSFPTNVNGIAIVFSSNSGSSTSQVGNYVNYTNVLLEQNSTATDYEPYVGGVSSPNPDYPQGIQSVTGLQNVNVCGKNLLDASKGRLGTFSGLTISYSNGEILLNGTATALVDFYVATKVSSPTYNEDLINYMNNNIGAYTLSNNLRFENYFRIGGSYLQNTGTTTSTNKVDLIFVRIPAGTYNNKVLNIQLELGSTATTYEPYKGNTYEVNLVKENVFNFDNYVTKSANVEIVSQTEDTLVATVNQATTWQTIRYNINNLKNNTDYSFKFDFENTYESDLYKHTWLSIRGGSTNLYNDVYYKDDVITFNTGDNTTIGFIFHVTINAPAVVNTITINNVKLQENIELNKIGDYEDSIKKSTGKNLFDKDNANVLNGNLADGGTLSSTNNARTLYIPCKNNTTYTITKAQAVYFRVAQFTNIPAIGDSYISRTKNDTANSITFTTTTGNYLAVTYWYNTSTNTEQQVLDSLMINEGSTALPYEPYGKVWYITKNIGKVVLDGSENWRITNTGTNNWYYSLLGNYGETSQLEQLCNYYPNVGIYGSNTNQGIMLVNNGAEIRIRYGTEDTVTNYKSWLSTHNVKLLYPTTTPTYTTITNTELINQLESLYNAKSKDGTTNINVTSEDLSMILNVGVLKGDAE